MLGPGRGSIRNHFRASQVALWDWLLPSLESAGQRFGRYPSFNEITAKDGFSGPTRPRALHPLTTDGSASVISPSHNKVLLGISPYPMPDGHRPTMSIQEVMQGKQNNSYMSNFNYTTALSLTAALGLSLLLLNILVLAAFHYRKTPGVSKNSCYNRRSTSSYNINPIACEEGLPSTETLNSTTWNQERDPRNGSQ